MQENHTKLPPLLSSIFIGFALIIMAIYQVGFLFAGYFPGFMYESSTGEVGEIYAPEDEVALKIGDHITHIHGIPLEAYNQDPFSNIWGGLEPGDPVDLQIVRNGQPMQIEWEYVGFTRQDLASRLYSQWWLAYFFWAAGLATYLLIRPTDTIWRLFISFNLLSAIWYAAGTGPSGHHLWYGPVVTRIAMYLSVPVLIHLHWIFPRKFSRIPAALEMFFLIGNYVLFIGLAIFSFIFPPISTFYTTALLLGLLISILLQVIHYISQKDERGRINLIARVTIFAFLPVILSIILSGFIEIPPFTFGAALVGLPLIPFSYFLAIGKGRLSTHEFRANRALALYLFFATLTIVVLLTLVITQSRISDPTANSLVSLCLTLTTTVIALTVYPRFQRLIEKYILGIPASSEGLLQSYSAQITSTQDNTSLSSLLNDLILPSLTIRQSALICFEKAAAVQVINSSGISEAQIPTQKEISSLSQGGVNIINTEERGNIPQHLQWVRVAIPLEYNKAVIGVWLLGRRDPNDQYEPPIIKLLQSLAHQTSLALINHRQTQYLRALYQANIDRHETERASLARELHDETLNNLALLQHITKNDLVSKNIDEIITKLRKSIHGLRPEMLSYGLLTALQDLGDTLNERQNETSVEVDIKGVPVQINPKIELYIFRIVQQACENALRHSQALSLTISGKINQNFVDLTVEDDGVGFQSKVNQNRTQLLADKHYGLANMYERADLIGAVVTIESKPEIGTVVSVKWERNKI